MKSENFKRSSSDQTIESDQASKEIPQFSCEKMYWYLLRRLNYQFFEVNYFWDHPNMYGHTQSLTNVLHGVLIKIEKELLWALHMDVVDDYGYRNYMLCILLIIFIDMWRRYIHFLRFPYGVQYRSVI